MSDKRKVYLVNMTVSFDMAVAAESKEAAEAIAKENYEEDMREIADLDLDAFAHEMVRCPEDYKKVIPWGPDDDDPQRDWTIEEYFESKS